MKFQRMHGKRKQSNPKRGIILVILLAVVILLWFNAEDIINRIFSK